MPNCYGYVLCPSLIIFNYNIRKQSQNHHRTPKTMTCSQHFQTWTKNYFSRPNYRRKSFQSPTANPCRKMMEPAWYVITTLRCHVCLNILRFDQSLWFYSLTFSHPCKSKKNPTSTWGPPSLHPYRDGVFSLRTTLNYKRQKQNCYFCMFSFSNGTGSQGKAASLLLIAVELVPDHIIASMLNTWNIHMVSLFSAWRPLRFQPPPEQFISVTMEGPLYGDGWSRKGEVKRISEFLT